MGIWENLGMGGYRGFSRPAARLLQQAVQLAGDLGCEQADTSHLLLAMLQQQGAAPHHGLCAHWGAERPRQPGRAGASSLRHAGR